MDTTCVMYILKIDYNVANIGGPALAPRPWNRIRLADSAPVERRPHYYGLCGHKNNGTRTRFRCIGYMAGLVSIIPARHKACLHLGGSSSFGIISCMFTALFILPAVIDVIYVIKNKRAMHTRQLMFL